MLMMSVMTLCQVLKGYCIFFWFCCQLLFTCYAFGCADEDDDFSESEGEERRVLKKARTRQVGVGEAGWVDGALCVCVGYFFIDMLLLLLVYRSRNFDAAPLARSGSRRSAGSAGGARNKGASRLGGKASSGARAKTSGGGSARKKRSRSDFEDEFEDEFEEEEEELSGKDQCLH